MLAARRRDSVAPGLPAAIAAIAAVLAAGCEQNPTPAADPDAAAKTTAATEGADPRVALGFQQWHDDFPFPVHLSPRTAGQWYGRSRRAALEQVVANLQGNCTREAWQFAKLFFDRAPPGAVDALAQAMERSFLAQGLTSHVENIVNALGRMGDPQAAPVLVRAMSHSNIAVRSAAVSGLVRSGTPEALRAAKKELPHCSGRAYVDWMRAVVRHMGAEGIAELAEILRDPHAAKANKRRATEQLGTVAAKDALPAVEPLLEARSLDPDMVLAVASILHRAGDTRGTALLRGFLTGDNPLLKAQAVHAAAAEGGRFDLLRDDVLRLVDADEPEVRTAVAEELAREVVGDGVPGETNVDDILETLAADPAASVRQMALRALSLRGRRAPLDDLAETIRTATGAKLRLALQDAAAAADPKVLEVVYERYQSAPDDDKRSFMQTLGYSRRIEVFPYLRDIFLGREFQLGTSGLSTAQSAALLLANLDGGVPKVVALFEELPRDDYRRRALLMQTVGNVAGMSEDRDVRDRARTFYKGLWSDRDELPQIRLLALQYGRRFFDLDDAMALKAGLAEESDPMRRALSDLLFEFF